MRVVVDADPGFCLVVGTEDSWLAADRAHKIQCWIGFAGCSLSESECVNLVDIRDRSKCDRFLRMGRVIQPVKRRDPEITTASRRCVDSILSTPRIATLRAGH